MPVQSETELVSFQDLTVRFRRASEEPRRLLLLVHGWTGDENSMWVFVRNFDPHYWLVAPRAPYATSPSGYSWRPAHGHAGQGPTFDDLKPSAETLLRFVDAYAAENHLDPAQFDAIGFSQGAVLVATLALLHPERIGRAGVLSGFLPAGAEPLASLQPVRGKPFFVAHGTHDTTVPIEIGRRSVQLLEQAGADVTYCEDEVGHKLGAGCMRALQAYFAWPAVLTKPFI